MSSNLRVFEQNEFFWKFVQSRLKSLNEFQFQVLELARQRQETQAFKDKYKQRADIEGTLSQAVRVSDLRYARYVGLAKTHLKHLATLAGINLARIMA